MISGQPITHRAVWSMAGPIILANLSVPLVGAVDTAVVGHLPGPEYIGAVALGALIFSFLYWGFGFLRMGTTGFVARTLGAADHAAMERLILRVLLLALVFGLLVLVLGRPVVTLALWLIEGTAEVERLAGTYAHIRLWSAPATLCIYVCTGVFIGLKNTRYVLTLQLVLNLTNVLLDLIFVPWLGFGVEGVAWATLIAEYLAAGLGLWMLRPWLRRALDRPDWGAVLAPGPMAELMKSNGHLLVRTLCLVFAFSWFTAQSATLGELVLAANSILLHLQTFMAYGLDGFAHAAESLTGEASGARNRRRFRLAVRMTTLWAAIVALIIAAIYLAAGPWLLTLFSDQAPVLEVAGKYLPWMILSPLVSVWSYQLDGIFIGSGNTREMQNAMALSTAIFVALTWMLLPWLGNHGLFLALTLFMGVRALTLLPYYRRALPAKA
ncbi:MAG: MATE family efflux transporter [Gammaproteobacteria bacterium]|nr:MATE family efflux transporter [Gammaproteobacteria bacterium]